MSTLREEIVASRSGKRMFDRVSPIYDESYVGLWMFEAIGREYDKLWEIADTLPQQMFVESVTWAIELWEQRYGITPAPSQSIEERRRKLIASRSAPRPFIPAILEQYIMNLTGRQSEVIDHIREYTFGVYITSDGGKSEAYLEALLTYINRNKPSHISCELAFQAVSTIGIKVETGYWRFPYWTTDSAAAGQLPDTNIIGRLHGEEIEATGKGKGYTLAYEASGVSPYTNTLAAFGSDNALLKSDGQTHRFGYPLPGESDAGTKPLYVKTSGTQEASIRASPEDQTYKISYTPCGATNSGTGIL